MIPEQESKKPDNTAFKQQRMPAWQPILTAKSVFPTFFLVSIVFIPIGVVLLVNSRNIVQFERDYTDCESMEFSPTPCSQIRTNRSRMEEACTCRISFTLDTSLNGDVYLYYGLSNFFQNHRRYVKSRDDTQLVGQQVTVPNSDCSPYDVSDNGSIIIAPCGAIANSLFNDTYTLVRDNATVPFLNTGIAWATDHSTKFNNPLAVIGNDPNNLTAAFINNAKPKYWQKRVEQLDPNNPSNNGYKNEALIVWMRTAAFPTFRKLHGRLNRTNGQFQTGLTNGDYSVTIAYNYPVTAFSGRKRFILSTTSWIGGKNDFLGIAYITFGCLSFVVGVILCCLHYQARKMHSVHVK